MSNPYGLPGGPGQQSPGSFGPPGGPSWATGQPGPGYGQTTPGQNPSAPPPGSYGPGFGAPAAPGSAAGFGGPGPAGYRPEFGGSGPAGPESRPPAKPRKPADLGMILPLIAGGIGALAFVLGFLPALSSDSYTSNGLTTPSVFEVRDYLPILILLAGLFAVAPLLPGGRKYTVPTALVAIAGLLGAISSVFTATQGVSGISVGWALWLLLVVSIVQTAVAVYGWLVESGTLKQPSLSTGEPARHSQPPASAPAPATAPGANQGGFGGYAPGAYAPPAGASSHGPDSSSYGSYGSSSYPQPNPRATEQYAPSYGTGATPTADTGPREGGPAPDVTQQVRF